MATRMQQRRGTAAQWLSTNSGNGPILNAGEIGFESDTGKFKVGDGVNHWIDLEYFLNEAQIATDIEGAISDTEKGAPNGVATLDSNSKLTSSQLPDIAQVTVHAVANQAARLALSVQPGDIAIQSDNGQTYVLSTTPASTNGNWTAITVSDPFPTHDTDDLAEGTTNKYFTDERAQDAIGNNLGTGLSYNDSTGAISVDNTIATLASPALTGTPTAPTASAATNTTQIATTAFVKTAIANVVDGAPAALDTLNELAAALNDDESFSTTVTNAISERLSLTGGTMTGPIDMDSNTISGLPTPTTGDKAANKTYVDNAVDPLAPKASPTFTGTVTLPSDTSIGNVSSTELQYVNGVTSGIQDQINSKASSTHEHVVADISDITATVSEINTLDGITASTAELNILDGATLTTTELNYVDGVTSGIQSQLDGKSATGHGHTSADISDFDEAAQDAVGNILGNGLYYDDASGVIVVDTETVQYRVNNVSDTEIGYLDGVTSAIQTQLNSKALSTDLSDHENDTTNVHGITDTSNLVTTDGTQTLTNKTIETGLFDKVSTFTGETTGSNAVANFTIQPNNTSNKMLSFNTTSANVAYIGNAGSMRTASFTTSGTLNAEAQLTVKGTNTGVGTTYPIVKVTGSSGQTNNMLTINNNSGTTVASIDKDGNVDSAGYKINGTALKDVSETLTNKTLTSPTITGTVTLPEGSITSTMIADGTIVNADINASAAIALSKLATNPLARANHTGTQTASTISDFDTQVRTSKVTDLAAPTGSFSMNSQKITSLADPTNDQDAATKAYVDAATAGLNVHASVKAATTANINLTNGVKNNDVLDGVTLATGNRILVKNQNTAADNGVYVVGAGAATRATDYDSTPEVDAGDFIFVESGTVNGKTGWVQTNAITTINTDAIEFTQFSGAGTYAAGTGLTLTGNTFSINTSTTADLSTAQTLTNKTISGANNTLTVRLANDVTGTLPVANGGTGVTTSTGSGNVVLSTSPTLTTPALGTPSSVTLTNATGLPVSTGISGLGTGVATALAVNVGTAGAPVVNGGALGTPSSGTLTNATGLPVSTGISGFGTGVATALATNIGSAGAPVTNGGALGTPSSGTLTNATGLPLTTGVTGTLPVANGGTGVTTSTGSGNNVLSTSPTLVTPVLGTPTSVTLTNATGLPLTTGVTGTLPVANGGTGITSFGTGVATFLGTPSSANLAAAVTDETGSGALVFGTSPTIATPTFTGLTTVSSSGIAFTDGTQTKEGVPSRTAINAQTGTTYTTVLSDRDSLVELNNASAITITIPPNSSVAYPVGTSIDILQTGAGQVTIAAGAGVTVNATPGLKLRTQWSSATLFKRNTDTWVVMGDLSA